MPALYKLFLYALVLSAVLAVTVLVLPTGLALKDLLLPCTTFTLMTALSILVFIAGTHRKTENQPLFTMGALGIKFMLSMVFALIYFIVLKNTGAVYVLLFFLLYLAFTVYLLRFILKTLKIKSLK